MTDQLVLKAALLKPVIKSFKAFLLSMPDLGEPKAVADRGEALFSVGFLLDTNIVSELQKRERAASGVRTAQRA